MEEEGTETEVEGREDVERRKDKKNETMEEVRRKNREEASRLIAMLKC